MARTALNYTKDQGSLQGVVTDHISPFRHIINYAGKYLEAYVWPGSNCDPKIGDKVTFKPFPNGGFNMIISGQNHDESNILVGGASSTWSGGSTNKLGFQWRRGSDDWHKVYSGDPSLLIDGHNNNQAVKAIILKGSVDGTIPDSYFMISSSLYDGIGVGSSPSTAADDNQNFTLQRSRDFGVTWATLNGIYSTINDIAFDINKNLWAVSGHLDHGYPGPYPYENNILKSLDNGDTWQVMWTESGADNSDTGSQRGLVQRVLPHPTDPLTVIVIYGPVIAFDIFPIRILVTIDGGLNWNEIATAASSLANRGCISLSYHWIKDTGRLIISGIPEVNWPYNNHSGRGIWADGPNYDSWTVVDFTIDFRFDYRYDSTADPATQVYAFSLFGDSDGSRIFAGGEWRGGGSYFGKGEPWLNLIFVSYDQGKSFQRFCELPYDILSWPNDQGLGLHYGDPPGTASFISIGNGGTYDEINDAIYWYVIPNDNQGPNNHQITKQWNTIKMFPIIYGEDTAYDITQNLQPFVNEFTDNYGNPDWGDGRFNSGGQATQWSPRLMPY